MKTRCKCGGTSNISITFTMVQTLVSKSKTVVCTACSLRRYSTAKNHENSYFILRAISELASTPCESNSQMYVPLSSGCGSTNVSLCDPGQQVWVNSC